METIYSYRKIVLPCPYSEEQKLLGSTDAQVSYLHGLGWTQSSLEVLLY